MSQPISASVAEVAPLSVERFRVFEFVALRITP